MGYFRVTSVARATLAALLLLAALACDDDLVQEASSFSQPEDDSDAEAGLVGIEQTFVEAFLRSPCDTEIARRSNEVHDCQRLVRDDTIVLSTGQTLELGFGPLVGILPIRGTLNQGLGYYQNPRPVAYVSNAGALSGDNGYAPLDIGPSPSGGGNVNFCLWLYAPRGPETLTAAIAPTSATDPTNCGDAPDEAWGRLEVDRQTYGNAPVQRYPSTARWLWSIATRTHYIGIKCGDGWCSIGVPDFAPATLPQPTQEPDARRAIPGWHDQQFLATNVLEAGARDSTLVPGPWASVYPLVFPEGPTPGRYEPTARVELVPHAVLGVGPYGVKYNLAGYPDYTATIELFWDGVGGSAPMAQFRNGVGSAQPSHGVRTGPDPHGPAGAARFRWHDVIDETMWVPCRYYGCCDVEEDGG